MIADDDTSKQAPRPPGPDRPCLCPHGGHSHSGYDPQASPLLNAEVLPCRP